MANVSSSLRTVPRGLPIGFKLGAALLALAIFVVGNLALADWLHNRIADISGLINQNGRLRYLSQRIALYSAGFVLNQDVAYKQAARAAESEFERHAAELLEHIRHIPPFLRNDSGGLEAHLGQINALHSRQHALLEQLLAAPAGEMQRRYQNGLMVNANLLLTAADEMVAALEDSVRHAHAREDAVIYALLLPEVLLLLAVFFYLRARAITPILELVDAGRRFFAGDWGVQVRSSANDEIGDLVKSFNEGVRNTAALIAEVNRRAQENATLADIIEITTDFVGTSTLEGQALYLNRAARKMLGIGESEDIRHLAIADLHSPEMTAHIFHTALPVVARNGLWSGETRVRTFAGVEVPVSQVIIAHHDEKGAISHYSTLLRDVTHFKLLERRLQSSLEFHLKLLQEFPNPIWRLDRDNKCNYVNRAWLEFCGRTEAQELGDGWIDGIHPEDREHFFSTYLSALSRRVPFTMECRMRHRDGNYRRLLDYGTPYTNLDGEFAGYFGTCHDIEDRYQYQAQIEHQARHDALTGLPNRSLLTDRLDQAILHARRHDIQIAVLFLDLDNFKVVNDSLGHEAGDRMLIAVSQRLVASLRAGDSVARQGGDEFVILLADLAQEEDVAQIARKMLAALAVPLDCGERELVATASIGIALYPRDGEDQATLLRNADTALYRAKEAGRNNFQFYAADMNQSALARLNLERDLRRGLDCDEFLLHYQPNVDLASGAITGVEALVRWRQPGRGLVFPAEFIPLAEETGLIVPLGEWVLREACRQIQAWRSAGLPELRVAVNLSARQLLAPGLIRTILGVLAETGLVARLLELEITESMVMHNPEGAIAVLRELQRQGIALTVDDFGSGYSSLTYLKTFPVGKLKIDQSFVHNIATNAQDAAIVSAVIDLAHKMGLKITAEGVETQAQHAFLRTHRCDEIQGFLFCRPLPAGEIEAMLKPPE